MSEMEVETALPPDLAAAVTGLHDTLNLLLGYDTASLTAPGLLALTVQVETIRRRLAALDHVLIAEIGSRHLAVEHGATSTAALLRPLLRIAPREASRRVKAAADVGPRRTLTGEPLPALFEGVFAAQACGVISAEHAAIVVGAVNYLPDAIQADCDREVEATLVDWATQLEPELLRKSAKLLVEALNPDGVFSDDRHLQRVRGIAMSESSDGMFDLRARLTPICAAVWQPIFDSLARPVPAVDGAADERQPAQRMHDAFHDAGLLLLRSGELSDIGGVPVTILVTMTDQQLASGTGYATTGHGSLIPVTAILDLAGEAQTVGVVVNSDGGVMNYGQTKRLVPASMRRALIARDQGCTFPGCDMPPAWTQAHHFQEFAAGGETSIENCGLVCGHHHRTFEKHGWRSVMITAIPHFVPPKWIDPDQKPLRNTTHHPTLSVTRA